MAMYRFLFLTFLCTSLPFLSSRVDAASADEWTKRSIYQLITDRFSLSDNSGPYCDASAAVYCGGSWQGVINHLDYIQGMGFDAVWISPVVQNINQSTSEGQGYHGYWASDINAFNDHFGSLEDLQALSSALHERSMYLMLDVVANHMASAGVPSDYSSLQPFNTSSMFHDFCFISDYNNQTNVEQCWLGDTTVSLPDLNTEDDYVINTLYSWIHNLVQTVPADGLRIDTVKHIRKDFWPGFASSANVFTLGEVFDGDTGYTAPYTDVIDSILDYPTYYTQTRAFTAPGGDIGTLISTYQTTQSTYKNGAFNTGSFLENQDNPRFQSITQDQALVKNAITWNFVTDGIPILYYGQEQGYTGGAVPNNREALWYTAYTTSNPLIAHVTNLNAARRAAGNGPLSNFYSTPANFLSQTGNSFAISKPPLLTLLTNIGSSASSQIQWNVPNAGFNPNKTLVDVLTCEKLQTDATGTVTTMSSMGMPKVFLPESIIPGSGLCA